MVRSRSHPLAACGAEDRSGSRVTALSTEKLNFAVASWRVASGKSPGPSPLAPWRVCEAESAVAGKDLRTLSWATGNFTIVSQYLSTRGACAELRCLQHPLTFVHVPKAAGSFIAHVALQQAGILWGQHYARHLAWPPADICGVKDARPAIAGWASSSSACSKPRCPSWHIPPSMLPADDPRPQARAPFRACIVRDPLLRLLSEYTYRLKGKEPCATGTLVRHAANENVSACTAIARGLLEYAAELERGGPFVNDCHVLAQTRYVAPGWMRVPRLIERHPNGPWGAMQLGVDAPLADHGCNVVVDFSALESELRLLYEWAALGGMQVRDEGQNGSSAAGGAAAAAATEQPYPDLRCLGNSSVERISHDCSHSLVSSTLRAAQRASCLGAESFRALLLETARSCRGLQPSMCRRFAPMDRLRRLHGRFLKADEHEFRGLLSPKARTWWPPAE